MLFLCHYTQINPKINPCGINFANKGGDLQHPEADVGDWHRLLCYINF